MGVHCVFEGAEGRELQRQIYSALRVKDLEDLTIMEVFSPSRFAELASGFGFKSMRSFDYSDGWGTGENRFTGGVQNKSSHGRCRTFWS